MIAVPSDGGTFWFSAVPVVAPKAGVVEPNVPPVVPAPPCPNNGAVVELPNAGLFCCCPKLKDEGAALLLPKALVVFEPNVELPKPPLCWAVLLPKSPPAVLLVAPPPKGLLLDLAPKSEPELLFVVLVPNPPVGEVMISFWKCLDESVLKLAKLGSRTRVICVPSANYDLYAVIVRDHSPILRSWRVTTQQIPLSEKGKV